MGDVEAGGLKKMKNHGKPKGVSQFVSTCSMCPPPCLPRTQCEKAPAGVNVGISLMVVCTSSDSAVMKWQPVKSVLSPLT